MAGAVVIDSSVTDIYGFTGCTTITSIIIPISVTYIGSSAFQGCTSLTSVTIESESDKSSNDDYYYGYNFRLSIGSNAFDGCTSLTSITIPDHVTDIYSQAFNGCTSLASVTIGSGTINSYYYDNSMDISVDAFQGCTSLTSVTFNKLDFTDCSNNICNGDGLSVCTIFPQISFTSITIQSSVRWVGDGVFKDCTSLTSVSIPASVDGIGYQAFEGCTSLTSVSIPASVRSIDRQAFKGCTSLTKVSIMNSGMNSGNERGLPYNYPDSFEGCSSLSCIYFNPWRGMMSIGGFSSCCLPGTVIEDMTCSKTCQAPLEYYDSGSNSCKLCAYLKASTDSNDIYNTDDIYNCQYQYFGLNQGGTITILFLLVLAFVSCLAYIRDENDNFDWKLTAGKSYHCSYSLILLLAVLLLIIILILILLIILQGLLLLLLYQY